MTLLRADLHVHTRHSKHNASVPFVASRDCYSPPQAVYRIAKARGMDLVAITDHDTIDGALELLDRQPGAADIIVGEEVSCRFPDVNMQVHLGVYGISETLHRDVQPLRNNVFEVTAFLRSAGVFFVLNHLFHFYRRQIPIESYLRLLHEVPALETRNGAMLAAHNRLVEEIASEWSALSGVRSRLASVAGSDAHTLRRVGRTWTEAPGSNREEFLESLKRGLGRPGGRHGGTPATCGDVYGVIAAYAASLVGARPVDHHGWHRAACLAFVAASLPLQAFLPAVMTLLVKRREMREVRRARMDLSAAFGQRSRTPVLTEPEA
jgi:predicted metal-dependent phosphoesterase TrpH